MSSEVRAFYNNDIVYRFEKLSCAVHVDVGVVMDTYESTDPSDSNSLRKGQIRVHWSNGKSAVARQNKVKLFSRTIVPGDIVRRLEKGKETQRGYCRSVQINQVVRIFGSDKVIENVARTRLKPMYPFSINAPVCLGKKFGRIVSLVYLVRLLGPNGAELDVKLKYLEDDIFYIGQTIVKRPSSLGEINWIKKTKATQRDVPLTFIVQKITAGRVCIEVYNLPGYSTYLYEVPEEDIPKIQVLEIPYEYFGLQELRLLKLKPTDSVIAESEMIRNQFRKQTHCDAKPKLSMEKSYLKKEYCNKRLRSMCYKRTPTEVSNSDDEWTTEEEEIVEYQNSTRSELLTSAKKNGLFIPIQLICAEFKPTIIWQDGTQEKDVSTHELFYSISLDDHEFFCGEWVIKADETLDDYGVVQKVDYLARTATIKWFMFCCEAQKPIFLRMEEMSVYDIKKHPTFMFRPGSVVHRNVEVEENLGQVIDSYPEGFVKVKWINGTIEDCWPQHLSFLEDPFDQTIPLSFDDTESSDSWETETAESISSPSMLHLSGKFRKLYHMVDYVRTTLDFIEEKFNTTYLSANAKVKRSMFINLLTTYENLGVIDKLLGTSIFSLTDPEYQALLKSLKELAVKKKVPDDANTQNHQMDDQRENHCVPDNTESLPENLHEVKALIIDKDVDAKPLLIELIAIIKSRVDMAFNTFQNSVKSKEILDVITKSPETNLTPFTSTPLRSEDTTPDDIFTNVSSPIRYNERNLDALDWLTSNMIPNFLNDTDSAEPTECDIDGMNQLSSAENVTKEISSSPPSNPITSNNNVGKQFDILDEAPCSHRFYPKKYQPADLHQFLRAVSHENKLLRESLPPGVWVYTFANRMDLHTVMIRGPTHTPYEDGLFIFDLQLRPGHPNTPPHCVYISYNSERLNPNLYVDGKVCVSLLGTWLGRGTEVWSPTSTLLQLIVSLQGLILVAQPYYNEAGYEKQFNSQQGFENSRTYNELVLLRLVQSMTQMIVTPYTIFADKIYSHFREYGPKLIDRLAGWINNDFKEEPHFPLLPVSKGLKLSLQVALEQFQTAYEKHILRATKH